MDCFQLHGRNAASLDKYRTLLQQSPWNAVEAKMQRDRVEPSLIKELKASTTDETTGEGVLTAFFPVNIATYPPLFAIVVAIYLLAYPFESVMQQLGCTPLRSGSQLPATSKADLNVWSLLHTAFGAFQTCKAVFDDF